MVASAPGVEVVVLESRPGDAWRITGVAPEPSGLEIVAVFAASDLLGLGG
jgi:hypothetical protein